MPLTNQEYQKLGQAIAQQLQNVLGSSGDSYPQAKQAQIFTPATKSAEAIGREYSAEITSLCKDLVSDLKEAGHIPAGRELTEAVIVIQ